MGHLKLVVGAVVGWLSIAILVCCFSVTIGGPDVFVSSSFGLLLGTFFGFAGGGLGTGLSFELLGGLAFAVAGLISGGPSLLLTPSGALQTSGVSPLAILGVSILFGFSLGMSVGLGKGFFCSGPIANAIPFLREEFDDRPISQALVLIFAIGLGWGVWLHYKAGRDWAESLGGCLSLGSALVPALFFGRRLKPSLLALHEMWTHLRKVGVVVAGFGLGYFFIAFVFACFFGAAWVRDPTGAFKGLLSPAKPSFWDFFYFSTVTITTTGYGEITPASLLTRLLVCIEVVLGVGWMTVVFAAASSLFAQSLQAGKVGQKQGST